MIRFKKWASVTQKITLAILGTFLMLFLLVHAGINLCMLRNDGGEWFRAAAHFMGTNYVVKVMEVVLFACLILHILLAVILQMQNWMARPVRYRVPNKSKTRPGSKLMIYTGCMIAVFLVIHLMNFYCVKLGWTEGRYLVRIDDVAKADPVCLQENQEKLIALFSNPDPESSEPFAEVASNIGKDELVEVFGPEFTAYEPDFYYIARGLFHNGAYLVIYLLLILGLGFHLTHAFPSALHTLGLNGEKADRTIRIIGFAYAAVVVLMFYAVAIGINVIY